MLTFVLMPGVDMLSFSTRSKAFSLDSFFDRKKPFWLWYSLRRTLSTMSIEAIRPIPSLSSGTKLMLIPIFMISLGLFPTRLDLLNLIFPLCIFCKPAIASQSSFCPLPATPATPKTSPLLKSNVISFNTLTCSSSLTVRPLTLSKDFFSSISGLFMDRFIDLPTILSVNSRESKFLLSTVSMYSPFRNIVILSLISRTSFNFCDYYNRTTAVFHCIDNFKQFFCFLRRQNCCRFVQNKYFGPTVKHLQNLNALLFRHRHVVYLLVRIDFQSVTLRKVPYLFRDFPSINKGHAFLSCYYIFLCRQYIN